MRKKIVAGNWKMNTSVLEGLDLATNVINQLSSIPTDVEVVLIPPFTHLVQVVDKTRRFKIKVGAQNCAEWAKGAYTGEISASMIKSTGASYVVIGHSERREFFSEDNKCLYRKIKQALDNGLTPIYCCGEKLSEREGCNFLQIVGEQVKESLFELSSEDILKVVIAYEPVWAIGTGKNATSEQAQEMHDHIRKLIKEQFGKSVADSISILYGGSCKPSNAQEIFAQPDVDGGLIGGASLVADDFIAIANSFPKT